MIAFERATSNYDEATDTSTPATTQITGQAIQVKGKPERYKELGLSITAAPTLLFTPTDYPLRSHSDEFVKPGDTVAWSGKTWTVADVDPVAPDGYVIIARIVVTS